MYNWLRIRALYINFRISFFKFFSIDLKIQGETHDSIEDARTALQLYRKYLDLSRNGTEPDSFRKVLKTLYEKGRKIDWKVPEPDSQNSPKSKVDVILLHPDPSDDFPSLQWLALSLTWQTTAAFFYWHFLSYQISSWLICKGLAENHFLWWVFAVSCTVDPLQSFMPVFLNLAANWALGFAKKKHSLQKSDKCVEIKNLRV